MNSEDLIVISKQDLNSEFVNSRLRAEKEAKVDVNKAERKPVETSFFLNPIFYTAASGALAAFIGWILVEPHTGDSGTPGHGMMLLLMISLIGLLLGLFISAIEGLMSRNYTKALKFGAIGLGISLVWSLLGNFLAGILMSLIQAVMIILLNIKDYHLDPEFPLTKAPIAILIISMISRSSAWALLGLGIGLGPGIAAKSKKLFYNGVIGGMLGGGLGGLLFDPICYVSELLRIQDNAASSRAIGFVVLGLTTGAFIGLVENLAKDVWLTMQSGPLRGKQFVIYHNPTLIGSAPTNDIYIFKDPNVEPRHAQIVQKGNKYEIVDTGRGNGVFVNSQKIQGSKILQNNDNIVIGQSILQFQQKDKS